MGEDEEEDKLYSSSSSSDDNPKKLGHRPSLLPITIRTLRSSIKEQKDPLLDLLNIDFNETRNVNILRNLLREKSKSILSYNFSKEDLEKMKENIKSNCLRRSGNLDGCTRNYLLVVYGTESSDFAMDLALGKLEEGDHIFVLMPLRKLKSGFRKQEKLILNHTLLSIGKRIMENYQKMIDKNQKKINYTILIQLHKDPKEVVVSIAQLWKVQVVILGGASNEEREDPKRKKKTMGPYVRSQCPKCEVILV